MGRSGKLVASAIASFALVMSSTAAVASTVPAPAMNGWMTLSMLTSSGSAVLGNAPVAAVCGAAAVTAAVAQPTTGCVLPQVGTVPPPAPGVAPAPPPAAPAAFAGPGFPPLPVILIWLAVLGLDVYLLTKNHHHGIPNSPA